MEHHSTFLGHDPSQLLTLRGPAPVDYLPRACVHHQGVHAQHHRDREQVVAGGCAALLQGQGARGLNHEKDAEGPGQGQG